MALFVPPTAFHHTPTRRHRSTTLIQAPVPTHTHRDYIDNWHDKPLPPTPTMKLKKLRPGRLFTRNRRRTVLEGSKLTIERKVSEDIGGEDDVPLMPAPAPGANDRADGGDAMRMEGGEVKGGDEVKERLQAKESQEKLMKLLLDEEESEREIEDDTTSTFHTFTVPSETKRDPCFRCDIFATSGTDFDEAEKECKQLVIEAGGTVLEQEYPGGFMYTLPADLSVRPPLESSDETLLGGYIRITEVPPEGLEHTEPSPHELVASQLSITPTSKPRFRTPDVSPMTDRYTDLREFLSVSPTRMKSMQSVSEFSGTLDKIGDRDKQWPRPKDENPKPEFWGRADDIGDPDKQWPRPKDAGLPKKAGDWIKAQAAKRKEKIDEELKLGTGLEVVGESEYGGGIPAESLYMDGFSDLAIWMGTGGVVSANDD